MKRTLLIALLGICTLGVFAQKYVGGDISLLPKYEQAKAQYYDKDGKTIAEPLAFFKEQGMNAMRLRLFVDPSKNTGEDKDENVCQDLAYIKPLAKRIKDAGFKLMLDFHYSDTWADPGKQWTPDAWKNLSDADLQQKLYDYTKDVLQQLKTEGAEPDMIQTGNEISYGMLWGTRAAVGSNSTNRCWPSSSEANWTRFTNFLKQATKACREVCPEAKIILHTERTSISQQTDNKDYAALSNFYSKMKAAGIDYDIIGLSYYPYFHGAISELEGAINLLEKDYADKNIMIVEFGYPYAWAVPGSTYQYDSKYPYSDAGQKALTADVIKMLNQHKNVNGLFWWWMEYNAKGTNLSGWYNAPLFDSNTGKATSALYELKNFVGESTFAQGWPANHSGVMLQGFYWDSFRDSKWTNLEAQASELSQYFNLVWIPQSANCGSGKSMGYDDLYWFSNYNSSFGSESELRSLIKTFKAKGIGTIADVVINHRNTLTSWTDFPSETYKGVTYQMLPTDICSNDDNGATKAWADQNGVKLSSIPDTGEDWDGMRDLDHASSNVQTIVKAYLDMLLNDFGYTGFRYDMVKGYAGKYTGIYNDAAKPAYSVGEYWDGNAAKVKNWLNATKVNDQVMSAAFDFPIRYVVRDAINNDWTTVKTDGLINDKNYKQYAVTFIENHDTEYRSASEPQDPIKKDTLAGNAYILASCGTPCIFYKHWIDCKKDIKMMINARNLAGITNTSNTTFNAYKGTGYNGILTTGDNCSLLAVVGPKANDFKPTDSYAEILNGYHYRYFLAKEANVAWVDLPSGDYEEIQKARLVAVSSDANAQLVYTTDGTEPTASSKKADSNTEIEIPFGETTLKVGLLVNGVVTSIITRTYKVTEPAAFEPYDITVYANADKVGWNNGINFWAWCESPSENLTQKGAWPGDKVTQYKEIDGKKWYYQTYRIKSKDYAVSFVFSTGTGSPQTVDYTDVTQDAYLEIQSTKDGAGHYYINNVTSDMPTGIANSPILDKDKQADNTWYTLSGMKMNTKPRQAGIYIHQGKKTVVK